MLIDVQVIQKTLNDFSVGAIETNLLTRYRTDPPDDPLFVLSAIANARQVPEEKELRSTHERIIYKTRSPETPSVRRRSPRHHASSDRNDRERRTPESAEPRQRRSSQREYRSPDTIPYADRRSHDSRDDRRSRPRHHKGDRYSRRRY